MFHPFPSQKKHRQIILGTLILIGWVVPFENTFSQSLNCATKLSVDMLAEVFGERVGNVQIKATELEKDNTCNRMVSIGKADPFSDFLVFIISTASSPEGAEKTLKFMSKGHEKDFYYGWPEGIGDRCFRYLQPDLLSSHRAEMNVSFIKDNLVIELKYFNVDDGKDNKFIYSLTELEDLAAKIAARLP